MATTRTVLPPAIRHAGGVLYAGTAGISALDATTADLRWRTFTDTNLAVVARVSVVSGSIGGARPEQS